MTKKYFNYSFQIKRTKTTLAIFIAIIVITSILFFTWYKQKTPTEKLGELRYKEEFGMNEFKARDCQKSYRINYKKTTCGTICINQINKNNNYLNDIKNDMQKNGFEFSKEESKKIGNKNWNYIKTKNNKPIFNYYSINTNKNTYTIEYVDQTVNLDNIKQDKCNKIFNKVIKTIKIND